MFLTKHLLDPIDPIWGKNTIEVNGVQQLFSYQHTLPVQQKKYRFGTN